MATATESRIDTAVSGIVNLLGIDSGKSRYWWEDEPARLAVIAALRGEGEFTVTVADVPYQGDRYIVLGPLGDGPAEYAVRADRPLLVRAPLGPHARRDVGGTLVAETYGGHEGVFERVKDLLDPETRRPRRLTTSEVAGFWQGRANGIGDDPLDRVTGAPAASQSFAPVTIAGDLPESYAVTADENWDGEYDWYDLSDVPVGGSVYRISCNRTLWLYTRREADSWELTCVPDVKWALTSHRDGSMDVGALLRGAVLASALDGA